jgi:hypothetical protein
VHVNVDDALVRLGFAKECDPYSRPAAAVAHVVLEAIEHRLPSWACWKGDKLIQSRSYRGPHQKPRRQAALLPRELFAIDWALTAPGFSWPVEYRLVWTPVYERYVVTASADCPDMFGYTDFALGHFGREDNIGQSVIGIIKRDWTMLRDEGRQQPWETLLWTGMVKQDAVEKLAAEVWPQDDEDEDLDEDDGSA